ncbi:uncharacterized protein LOC122820613 [Gambusia affinis]|uniref:uncharacterized protein LOC122820613 n=1 Tax=Gambusia affinis TaxID=33528 RepID=UPI001CDB56DB|nr:uncharacterized protein LOC122820613 [Gambusia affinis]XP_043954111.1 uncharacterized protein LOC122820613 [Gambusia affinis]
MSPFLSENFADPNVSSIYSPILFLMHCLRSEPSSIVNTAFILIRISLHLPLCVVILRLGLRRWNQKRSSSSAAPMSHSDFFAYLAAIIELIDVLGSILSFIGIHNDDYNIFFSGIILSSFVCFGAMNVNVLTCVERYLAVVHPIAYLKLRSGKGIRIRNLICCCFWLFSIIGIGLLMLTDVEAIYTLFLLSLSLVTVSFCSFSVLCILIRPGPGEHKHPSPYASKNKHQIDPSKQRAFLTIVAITLVLLLRFAYNVVWIAIYLGADASNCMVIVCNFLFNMPSSLVLPLLFLQRSGKLKCCRV